MSYPDFEPAPMTTCHLCDAGPGEYCQSILGFAFFTPFIHRSRPRDHERHPDK